MPIDIRPAMPFDDRAQVQAVISAAWRSGHGHLFSAEEIAQVEAAAPGVNIFTTSWTVPSSGVIFLAIDGTSIVGVANLRPFPSDGGPALVEPMHVLPGRQRQGIGEALWRYVETYSRSRGDSRLDVYALTENPMAMGFYAKMGGRVVGTGEFRLGDHVERATHFQFKF
jgi:GNAT superfamily N-acetyltransferase